VASAYRFDEMPAWAAALLERERVGRLGLLDDGGRPRVLPVTYALAAGALWSAVDDKPKTGVPARVRYLRRRPQAALTADRYDDDWSRLAWVQVLGDVAVLGLAESGEGLDALTAKYEQYRATRPPGPFLRLVPERVVCWSAADAGRR
jgi:PPOX class probable F420-dependent enzyme